MEVSPVSSVNSASQAQISAGQKKEPGNMRVSPDAVILSRCLGCPGRKALLEFSYL
jgi:hypothetical protein